ncbi:MAG: tryptophan synthase subunit alpha [Bacillota bacterium]
MNVIQKTFTNNKLLIPYICGGDPDLDTTRDLIYTLDEGGADIIEIGLPFSDPLADGPVIQKASERALKSGTTLSKIIKMIKEININTPLVLMGYYNTILKYGKNKFIKDLKKAEIDGVIIPDLPYEQDPELYELLEKNNIAGILLIAPNTSPSRIKEVGKKSSGFLYCVSLLGVTGDSKGPYQQIESYISRVKKNVNLPLALGFGIDGPTRAKKVSKYVNGIIIGSAIVDIIDKFSSSPKTMKTKVQNFIKEIKNVI